MSVQKLEKATGLAWVREQDGFDNSDRPMYDYRAQHGDIRFHITKAVDAGFGLSVHHKTLGYLHRGYVGNIMWLRTLGNCIDRSAEIMKSVRDGRIENETYRR